MKKWEDVVANAASYLAIGQLRIYLNTFDGYSEFPWELATDVETGGSHRLDISTTLTFKCAHDCGLQLEWGLDLETRDANGAGEYKIDRSSVIAAIGRIPLPVARKVRRILIDDAAAIRKRADEFTAAAGRQYADAALFELLAKADGK